MCSSDIFLGLIAILFPPLAVWVKRGICSADSIINILLCMLGFLPGLLHAWYIIAKYPDGSDGSYERVPYGDAEQGRVTYVIVQSGDGRQHRVPKSHLRSGVQGQNGYGTTAPMAPPVHQDQNGTWNNDAAPASNGESSSGAAPPPYTEAVRGDHKVQTSD
ncbi:hypothetical protein BP6252_08347 [Coleophoma cylindrospora]|uniref:Uncharacterized protein n=1 Tax=Coleophoma cylindrospora TaxID=1849047 RepID=A0A3D8R5Q2_9HELO|nr:hypothetical protein BP6252_08347 [Coleophoma cylindrospora]